MRLRDLSVLAYANHFTLWHYNPLSDDIMVEGYFKAADDMVKHNDMMIVPRFGIFYITVSEDGSIGLVKLV